MSAWGRTGRVTLDGEVLPWVRVDEVPVGWVYTPDEDYAGWGPRTLRAYYAEHLPSLDAAVMWVLRRVDPGLWREERGEVWRVERGPEIAHVARWHVHAPSPEGRILFGEGNTSPCPNGCHDDSYSEWWVAARVAYGRAASA